MKTQRADVANGRASRDTNLALWLDRYFVKEQPDRQLGEATHGEQRAGAEQKNAVTSPPTSIRTPDGYEQALARRKAQLRRLDGGFAGGVTRLFKAEAEGRVVVGMGEGSAWENNITLCRTWGTPYIPGSALKGLTSSYAARNGGEDWHKPNSADGQKGVLQSLMFGSLGAAGEVTFHDAWWEPTEERKDRCPVESDVITVHHASYYGGSAAPPADWDEPNPVTFFATTGVFWIAVSGPVDAVECASELLAKALKEDGIGAKTNAGYGRLSLEPDFTPEERAEHAKRAKRQGILNDLARDIRPNEAASALPTRLEELFSGDVMFTEQEQRSVLVGWCGGHREVLASLLKRQPGRVGAELIHAVLEETKPAPSAAPVPVQPVQSQRELQQLTNTTGIFAVKGRSINLVAVVGAALKKEAKAMAIAGKSPNPERQKARVQQLLARGDGEHEVRLSVTLENGKVKSFELLDE